MLQFRASNAYAETFRNSLKTLIINSITQHAGGLLRKIIERDAHHIKKTTLESKKKKRPRKKINGNLKVKL